MKCEHTDCFTCPYPDCVADSTFEMGVKRQKRGEIGAKNKKPKKNTRKNKISEKARKIDEIKKKKYNSNYYRVHREEILKRQAERYRQNAEEIKAYQKAYYEANSDEICEKAKEKRRKLKELDRKINPKMI